MSKLPVIKIALDEETDPALCKAVGQVPLRSRGRRLTALATLGLALENSGFSMVKIGPMPHAAALSPAGIEPERMPQRSEHPVLAPLLVVTEGGDLDNEELDQLLNNLGGPLKG